MAEKRFQIGVLSDTHLADPEAARLLAERLQRGPFADVDMILHAGDIVNPDLLVHFAPLPVHAVRGNMDPFEPGLPNRRIVEAGRFRIGLIHGWGAPHGQVDRLLAEFADAGLDALVFGHTHRPLCRHQGGVLVFNPGSATDRRDAPYHTVGILDVGAALTGRIVRLDGPGSSREGVG